VDAGKVTNTATAQGTPPNSTTPVVSNPSSALVTVTPAPALALVKSATPTVVTKAGDTVTYSFAVTNTGNTTLSNISVGETAFSGTGTVPAASCPPGTLAPGASLTCTATYPVTQADIDAGSITNTAVAHGTPPNSSTPVDSNPSSATVTAQQAASIALVKTATPAQVSKAGDTVSYSFAVTNTGNVTLDNVGVTETAFSGTGTMSAISCPVTTLAPGASTTCTATYAVTQADVDAGTVTNTATAQGTPPGSSTPVVSAPSDAVVTIPPGPAIALLKTATPTVVTKAGDTVSYSFAVTNTGNTTLSNISVGETAFSGTGTMSAISCPVTTLAPGASLTCTATYAVTQADVDAGTVTNTATAQGTPPGSTVPVISAPSSAAVTIPATPALTLKKTADRASVAKTGETVTYSFKVTNTGNVTVKDITVREDAFNGSGKISTATCPAPAASLAPGASVTCTATYQVTTADLDSGIPLVNTATATGTAPTGAAVVSNQSTATVTTPKAPVAHPPGSTVHTGGYRLEDRPAPTGQPWWAFALAAATLTALALATGSALTTRGTKDRQ
jgi:uncharacterized repeat protein (TIGR01451 family)